MLRVVLLSAFAVALWGAACSSSGVEQPPADPGATTAPAAAPAVPTDAPAQPSPTAVPTAAPTATKAPTAAPTATAVPTAAPTAVPTPTKAPPPPTPAPTPPPAVVGVNVGDVAPAFTLKSATGGEHSLESYRGDRNLVVVFYRAFW